LSDLGIVTKYKDRYQVKSHSHRNEFAYDEAPRKKHLPRFLDDDNDDRDVRHEHKASRHREMEPQVIVRYIRQSDLQSGMQPMMQQPITQQTMQQKSNFFNIKFGMSQNTGASQFGFGLGAQLGSSQMSGPQQSPLFLQRPSMQQMPQFAPQQNGNSCCGNNSLGSNINFMQRPPMQSGPMPLQGIPAQSYPMQNTNMNTQNGYYSPLCGCTRSMGSTLQQHM
jgi:hypothetical protein